MVNYREIGKYFGKDVIYFDWEDIDIENRYTDVERMENTIGVRKRKKIMHGKHNYILIFGKYMYFVNKIKNYYCFQETEYEKEIYFKKSSLLISLDGYYDLNNGNNYTFSSTNSFSSLFKKIVFNCLFINLPSELIEIILEYISRINYYYYW